MDIAALSIVLNQTKVQQQAGLSVVKLAMDVASNQSDSLILLERDNIKAMETSVQPFLGANLDIQV
ncbi:hypothetical protein Desor_1475 [Desulfosporosinus orientis DSM 765]|uniref:Motility protein n=1 Tax=Desulfosporosinus orientis (strain ATCC 19365 / DSM 765 / NCIMB 8382 / VKM B-1628 / Singapore I) TaxID=768706 RepID=G7WAS1_DESOD|nr:YjfB family protein [Desulfosporosinus orientis]AET67132.1 hypothetical protein Desor_1475 [Desulfosporosinus orientis DSM 765]